MDQAHDQFGTADGASDESPEAADSPVPFDDSPQEGAEPAGEASAEGAEPESGEGTSGESSYDAPTGDDVSAPAGAGIGDVTEPGLDEGTIALETADVDGVPTVDDEDPDAIPAPPEGDEAYVAPSDGEDEPVDEPQLEAPPADRQADEPVEDDSIAEVLAGEPDAEEPAAEHPATEEAEPETVEAEPETEAAARRPRRAPAAARAEGADRAGDPFGGPGDWYVVHTYAGYENKVKANLLSRIHSMQMEDKIFNVHIPMEDVLEIKGGKRQIVQRKVFPGYLLVKMFYDNDSWYVVRNTPGVTGFVSSGTGTKPTPLSKREVEKILAVKQETEAKPQFRLEFEEGDTVRIISGPFADFNGTISEINVDQSKLKVLVNIFDRETPVELGFDQVAKV